MVYRSRRASRRVPLLLAAALVAGTSAVFAPAALAAGSVSLTALGTRYDQDFNGLANTPDNSTVDTGIPTGWALSESGTNANTTYRVGTGSNTAGDTYSFGAAAGNTERAFGGLRSGTLVPLIGVSFTNNTGGTITELDVAYTGEQWRLGQNTTGRAADQLDVQLSLDATSLTTGTWQDIDGLDFASAVVTGTVGALNGNLAPNQRQKSAPIDGLSIANGATFWLRWTDTDLIPGADDGLAIDDFALVPQGSIPEDDDAPVVDATVPANGATNVPSTGNLSVTFSEDVDVTGSWFSLTCETSGVHTATVTGGPRTFTLNPDTDLAFGEDCELVIGPDGITDQDEIDPPDAMEVQFTTAFGVELDPCTQPYTAIPSIQGSAPAAAITGNVTTQGVVVGDFEGTAAASGFYLQDAAGDGNPATSDGIFVFTGNSDTVSVGQVVRVTGFARERNNQTTINGSNSNTAAVPAANIRACGTADLPPRTDVTLPFANADFPERYEGMRVRLPQDLVIAESFNYDRFGEIVLALPLAGEPRPFSATALDEPGAPANARTLANSLRRITLDDIQSAQNPPVLRHPNGDPFSLDNRFRGGDLVGNTVGILAFDFSLYRILPTAGADYTAVNDRPAEPEAIDGNVHVAAMNTLNYFLTTDDTVADTAGTVGPCGASQTLDCRGADTAEPQEFTRQRTKLLEALAGLDADVIGLNELENTPGVDPSGDLADGLGGYEAIDTGVIGTDAIKVGMIYRPDVVTPVGDYETLDSNDDPRFIDTKSRPALAQTFEVNATGARFTVVVNHLKSKGSDCNDVGDPDRLDGQGNCSQTRRAAAEALVDWLATDPTGSNDPDVLIMGDLNSYALEDTIDEIRDGSDDTADTDDDFINLIRRSQGRFAYSYTFDGQAGYLDHALANRSLAQQVEGAADWHINSDEPDILDYDTSFKPPAQEALYEPNPYRTSDHDPVIVGLTLLGPPAVDEPVVEPEPSVEGETVVATASFTPVDGDVDDAFTCAVDYGDGSDPVEGVVDGTTCTGPDHAYADYGTYTVTVTVEDGDGETGEASTDHVVVFAFDGFFGPIGNEGLNRMKAGSAAPVKFSLTGDQGLGILATGSPSSRQVACDASHGVDPVEETVTAGGSSLGYDAGTDTYTYVWKTKKDWSGTCRELSVTLVDGTTHTALFQFTK
jgi:predicted extracellular nuclease